jgi:hypothetical protein
MQGQGGGEVLLISWRNRVETDVKREMQAQTHHPHSHPHPRVERREHRTTQQESTVVSSMALSLSRTMRSEKPSVPDLARERCSLKVRHRVGV